MPQEITRAQFLRGNFSNKQAFHRPPWAVKNFTDLCTRCDKCVAACPHAILVKGAGGFPAVRFEHGYCDFCGACADACQPQALSYSARARGEPAWNWRARVESACLAHNGIACELCADSCESLAMQFSWTKLRVRLPEISASLCNGCGACISRCPENAIQIHQKD